jgi:hypothetical protein
MERATLIAVTQVGSSGRTAADPQAISDTRFAAPAAA